MLDCAHFTQVLKGISSTLPFGKETTREGLLLAWQSFPEQAKRELSNDHLTYAAGQYLMDSERPREMPVHLALLRYLYRLEFGKPNLAWGLKLDLQARMRDPSEFHPQPQPAYLGPLDNHDGPRHDPDGVLADFDRLLRAKAPDAKGS
jgi:hypothetical protein